MKIFVKYHILFMDIGRKYVSNITKQFIKAYERNKKCIETNQF